MLKQHIVSDSDTMQYLAQHYLGDPAKWKLIATYNKLDYPYLTSDQNFALQVNASGAVTFYLSAVRETATAIPKDTIVESQSSNLDYIRKYTTDISAEIPAGALSVDVPVTCTLGGYWGNINAGGISQISSGNPISGVSVLNSLAFYNGVVYNVKRTGDTLLIPMDEAEDAIISDAAENYAELLGGADLLLTNAGTFIADNYGDIASVSGVTNIKYALKHRWETERGSLLAHPNYGSRLHQLVGRKEPFIIKMIELEVIETALQDYRVEAISINSITKSGTGLSIDCDVKLVGMNDSQKVMTPLSV